MIISAKKNLSSSSAALLGSALKATRELLTRQIGESLYCLANDVLGYKDLYEDLHVGLCQTLQTPAERKLVLLPRGHFKTTLCTVSYPMWRLLRDRDIRIALLSATQSNAAAYLREIKAHLTGNRMLQFTFPWLRPASREGQRWSSEEITVSRGLTRKESTIEVAGVGSTMVGKHFDLIIYDDIVTPEGASTAEQRAKLQEWFRYSLSLLEPGGEIVVVGTRYHYHDLYGELLESGRYTTVLRRALEEGRPIFPGRFPAERLARFREEQGSYIFSCQYLNEPVDEERATFRRSWLRFVRSAELADGLLYFTTVDPSMGESAGADYTAIVTCGMDTEGNLYVVDLVRDHLTPHELIEELFRLHERWGPVRIGIEAVGFQATLIHFLNREMLSRGVRLPLVPLKRRSGETKYLRILALQPPLEQGQLFLVEGCPHLEVLEEELVRFPRGATDDLIDALADQLKVAFPPQTTDGVHRRALPSRHHRTGY